MRSVCSLFGVRINSRTGIFCALDLIPVVLATDELNKLTSKLESLLIQTGADQTEYKSLLQSLLDEVKSCAADVKTSDADVKSLHVDVKALSADVKTLNGAANSPYAETTVAEQPIATVALNLQSVIIQYKLNSRDPELVRAVAAIEREDKLTAELKSARDREVQLTAQWNVERIKLETDLKDVTTSATSAVDAADKRSRDAVRACDTKISQLESTIRGLEHQLQTSRDRESELSARLVSERTNFEAALKSATEREAERFKELSAAKAQVMALSAALIAIQSGRFDMVLRKC